MPSVQTAVHIYPIDGAVQRVGADGHGVPQPEREVRPGHRVPSGRIPADTEANIAWVRDYAAALQPYSAHGGYINFMDGDDLRRVAENYGPNYQRLREIKAKYDPQNLFHVNQNIPPGVAGRRPGRPASSHRRHWHRVRPRNAVKSSA